jgi:hypothetical protein
MVEIGSVAAATSGSMVSGRSTAARTSGDHFRERGSRSASEDAFE